MIMTCGSKTAPLNECNFALINGSFKSFAHTFYASANYIYFPQFAALLVVRS